MADVTLTWSGVERAPVLGGDLTLPLAGAWTAHVELDAPSAPTGAVTLRWLGTDLSGTVLRSGESEGRVTAQIVGGAGGLATRAQAQEYTNESARAILQQILRDGGESLASTSTASVLARRLTRWVRPAQSVGSQLDALTHTLGAIWRVLPDGSIWVGVDEWPEPGTWDHVVTHVSPEIGEIQIAPEELGLLPGHFFGGLRIDTVVYTVTGGEIHARATGHRAEDGAPADPMRAALWRLVDEHQGVRRIDWLALYPAVVVRDNGDGTVDLRPDNDALPTLSRVPVRVPAPGGRISVAPGKRCHLGWLLGAYGTLPYVDLWEPASGGKAVARVDDLADAGTITWTVVPPVPPSGIGQLTITYTPPSGAGAPTVIGPLSITGLAGGGGVMQLKAKIAEGSPHLSLPAGSTV